MADQADVEQKLVDIVAALLYPNGPDQPPVVTGKFKIYRGWPTGPDLDADLNAGVTNVTVYPRTETARNTDRFPPEWQERDAPVHTLTAAVDIVAGTVTIGGTIAADNPQFVTVVVNDSIFSYPCQATDTPAAVAAGLLALITASFTASRSGAVLSIVGASTIVARVGATGTVWKEVGRQTMDFQITIWAPSEETRTAVARLIDPPLREPRIVLADQSVAHVKYTRSGIIDAIQKEKGFRRDQLYCIEYATSMTMTATEITSLTQRITQTAAPTAPPVVSVL